jgi:hypothetical protein
MISSFDPLFVSENPFKSLISKLWVFSLHLDTQQLDNWLGSDGFSPFIDGF